ncbi:porphobilinogen synthase, partial [Bacteriovoracaceae bacterium]|nr:porphobilinogen synthase [Bacteriovoracaceae bacterium]
MTLLNIVNRPRRNRKNINLRKLVRENYFLPEKFVSPIFVHDGNEKKIKIETMPDCFRLSQSEVLVEVGHLESLGINNIILFPSLSESLKSEDARESFNSNGLIPQLIKQLKDLYPKMNVFTDIALDPYSTQGHDGIVDPRSGEILNDQTIDILCKMALTQAAAGADVLGPSDMMDGRVGQIRNALDENGFTQVSIMSYCAKYASAFYGPFRDALDSAPKSGDKK